MAIDRKYGQVTLERGTIGDDEQVFIFRAQDALLPAVLEMYQILCQVAGSPQHHIDLIAENRDLILRWQNAEFGRTKIPSSDSFAS